MTAQLDEIVETFQSVDDETRLELLLDYSKKLAPIPERYKGFLEAGMNRVPECMTPVSLWVEKVSGGVMIHADVAEEAPTVKGFLSIVEHAYNGATPSDLAELPHDLLNRLGLQKQIRMQRAVGISAMIGRLRREGEQLMGATAN